MICNGTSLLLRAPIVDMAHQKEMAHGTTYGLGEAGYDIRIAQKILFKPPVFPPHPDYPYHLTGSAAMKWIDNDGTRMGTVNPGRFIIASAMEEFTMPPDLVGIVHDKSTWARRGLSVFNTVIEPGWRGFLTLELVYHGHEELVIPAGAGIAQVVFHHTQNPARYAGRYQDQPDQPVPAKEASSA